MTQQYSLIWAMQVAKQGFETWAAKDHNKGWVRKIDGTPIPNDLTVNIAEAFRDALEGLSAIETPTTSVLADWIDQKRSEGYPDGDPGCIALNPEDWDEVTWALRGKASEIGVRKPSTTDV